MQAGDVVRFWPQGSIGSGNPTDLKGPFLGLLIEYHTWEKIARIFYEGKIVSLRAEHVQLAWRNPTPIR